MIRWFCLQLQISLFLMGFYKLEGKKTCSMPNWLTPLVLTVEKLSINRHPPFFKNSVDTFSILIGAA